MLNPYRWSLLACFLVFTLGGCMSAPHSTSGRVVAQDEHGMIDIAFSDNDRAIIRDYYGPGFKERHRKGPGGQGGLPPGLQKQLVRRGELPPGLPYNRFPPDLERRLSPLPDGYQRIMIGGSFVLFNENTRVIFDVFQEL
jgi:hypothetical protein